MKENTRAITINVAEDFSDAPGGLIDGINFYKKVVQPIYIQTLLKEKKLIIDFDGGFGYLNSFFEGCFTCFKLDFGSASIQRRCEFKANEDLSLIDTINEILDREEIDLTYLRRQCQNRLTNAEDSYQHYTMVDKDRVMATYALNNIEFYQSVLSLIIKAIKEENEE